MMTPPDWDMDVIEESLTLERPADYRPRSPWNPGQCRYCAHGVHGATCAVLDAVTDELCGCPPPADPE